MIGPVFRDIQSRFPGLLDAKANVQRYLRRLHRRPFEREYAILAALRQGGGDFVDVGANRGQSIDAIRLYHPDALIHAYEPNLSLLERLRKRYSSDCRLVLHGFGLGDEDQTQILYLPKYREFPYDGLASFERDRAGNWLSSETVWHFNPDLLKVVDLPCEIRTLDAQGLQPSFLKIHVQGYELECLKGGEMTIAKFRPVILMANHSTADAWLRSRGWLQFAHRGRSLEHLGANDVSLYNCVYLHRDNEDHRAMIMDLSSD